MAELEKADQNKNGMISMLSHELRNPLATITGATELWSCWSAVVNGLAIVDILGDRSN